jgi:GNAT superfamily N-acetyltransferase
MVTVHDATADRWSDVEIVMGTRGEQVSTRDATGGWAVTCFVMRVGWRRQGIATELLARAVEVTRPATGRTVMRLDPPP